MLTKSRRVLSVTIRSTFTGSPSRATIFCTLGSFASEDESFRSQPAAASAAAPAAPAPE
jgi:hypothetical protein